MIKNIQVRVSLKEEGQEGILMLKAAQFLGIPETDFTLKVLRKSIDARKQTIYFNYKLAVYSEEEAPESSTYSFDYKDV
ncbi:MAG: FAD-binding protein, partial [Arenibacter sp.]|nr:FAD-binding protein [Arenibacter sp.]